MSEQKTEGRGLTMTNELQERDEVRIPQKLDRQTTLELSSRIERGWIPNLFTRKNIEAAYDVMLEETKLLKAYIDRMRAANELTPDNMGSILRGDSDRIKKEELEAKNELEAQKREHKNKEELDKFEKKKLEADTAEQELRLKKAQNTLNETGQTKLGRVEKNLINARDEQELKGKYKIESIVRETKTKLDLGRKLKEAAYTLEGAVLNQGIARAAIAGDDVQAEGFNAMEYLTDEERLELQNIADTFQREIDKL